MTIIVSDTSPLNILIQIERVHLLPLMFSNVLIPPAVAEELQHPNAPDSVKRFAAAFPAWLVEKAPATVPTLPNLQRGEREAIALALELNAPLLIDELDGRAAAQSRGLQLIGAVGLLERAAGAGLIADLAADHDSIRGKRFHISDSLLRLSLQRHLAAKSVSPATSKD